MTIRYKMFKGKETLHAGEIIPKERINKDLYPIGVLPKIGKEGSSWFTFEHHFVNFYGLKETEEVKKMEQNPGILINGIRSFKTGVAKKLLERLEVIAKYRNAKYIYLYTSNPRMMQIAKELGYKNLGKDSIGTDEFYFVKFL